MRRRGWHDRGNQATAGSGQRQADGRALGVRPGALRALLELLAHLFLDGLLKGGPGLFFDLPALRFDLGVLLVLDSHRVVRRLGRLDQVVELDVQGRLATMGFGVIKRRVDQNFEEFERRLKELLGAA